MTPDDEARFISLWQQGLSHDAMAQQLGCPVGTIKSRAHTIQKQGKLQPRRRGGISPQPTAPRKQAPAEAPQVPQQTPRVSQRASERASSRVSKEVTMEVLAPLTPPAGASDMTPLLHDILQELRILTQGLAVRVSERVSGGVSFAPREKTKRWNLHLPGDLCTPACHAVAGCCPSTL